MTYPFKLTVTIEATSEYGLLSGVRQVRAEFEGGQFQGRPRAHEYFEYGQGGKGALQWTLERPQQLDLFGGSSEHTTGE